MDITARHVADWGLEHLLRFPTNYPMGKLTFRVMYSIPNIGTAVKRFLSTKTT